RARARYINESALLHADTALRVLEQELHHLADLSRQVVATAVYLPDDFTTMGPAALHEAVRQPVPMALREDAEALYERHIKGIYADIVEFMSRMDVSLLPEQQQAMLNLSMAARDLVTAVKARSEEHTSELQSRENLVCRLLLEKKKIELDIKNGARTYQAR